MADQEIQIETVTRSECQNVELCGPDDNDEETKNWYYESFKYCQNCRSFNWGNLIFHDSEKVCSVCGENGRQMKFPADGCTHSFCIPCSRKILFWDECRYHINPCSYGCPECPNGCVNPERGHQCYCEAYDAVKDKWITDNPGDSGRYNEDEGVSILDGEPEGSAFNSGRCPLCRRFVGV